MVDFKYILRFWTKVDRLADDECWLWNGCTDACGRGAFAMHIDGQRKTIKAYRFAFYIEHGRWPEMAILHSCDNPLCCNPRHLREGTQAENMRDAVERRRTRTGERHWRAKLTDTNVKEIRILAERGCTRTEIATRFGVSEGSIHAIIEGRTWLHVANDDGSKVGRVPVPRYIGERVRSAKLTEEKVRRIRELAASGYTAESIAKDVGAGRETVRAVIDGRSWKHVT